MNPVLMLMVLAGVVAGLMWVIQWRAYQRRIDLARTLAKRWEHPDQPIAPDVVDGVTQMTHTAYHRLRFGLTMGLLVLIIFIGILSSILTTVVSARPSAPSAGVPAGLVVMGWAILFTLAEQWRRVEASVRTTVWQVQAAPADHIAATFAAARQCVAHTRRQRGWGRWRMLLAAQVVLWACADALLSTTSGTSRQPTR